MGETGKNQQGVSVNSQASDGGPRTGADDWAVREADSETLHGRWRVIYTIAKDGGSGGCNSGCTDSSSSGNSSPA